VIRASPGLSLAWRTILRYDAPSSRDRVAGQLAYDRTSRGAPRSARCCEWRERQVSWISPAIVVHVPGSLGTITGLRSKCE
jgi:hypothetical protein